MAQMARSLLGLLAVVAAFAVQQQLSPDVDAKGVPSFKALRERVAHFTADEAREALRLVRGAPPIWHNVTAQCFDEIRIVEEEVPLDPSDPADAALLEVAGAPKQSEQPYANDGAGSGLPGGMTCTCKPHLCTCKKRCFCRIREHDFTGSRLMAPEGLPALPAGMKPQQDCSCNLYDVGGPGFSAGNSVDCDCAKTACGCKQTCSCKKTATA